MTLIAELFPKSGTPKNVVRLMSKNSRFRRPSEKQHGKRVQTLSKSERQHLYHIYWPMWDQLTYNKYLLVICKILRMFINTLTVKEEGTLLILDAKMTLVADLFPKLRTRKTVVRSISKKLGFRRPLQKQDGKGAQTLVKVKRQHLYHIYWWLWEKWSCKRWTLKNVVRSIFKKSRFKGPFEKWDSKQLQTLLKFEQQLLYHIYWSLWAKLSCKRSLLVIWKIARLFVNTLTANDKSSLLNIDNLTQPIQILLSQKQKNSDFSSASLRCSLSSEHFFKKNDPRSWCIFKTTDSEKLG